MLTALAVLAIAFLPGYSSQHCSALHFSGAVNPDAFTDPGSVPSSAEANADSLRLASEGDRAAFRQWFTFIAEAQYFRAGPLAREIRDCAALLRFAYREALREHDSIWAAQMALPLAPAIPEIRQYHYPWTPIGPALFRVRGGSLSPDRPAFAEFADAETLRRFNTNFISREATDARSGDLLFFRQLNESATYHAMIFVGHSQIEPGPDAYVVYHTGPNGNRQGEIRRLTLRELLTYPDARWRPAPGNRAFLGIYRWNILSGAD